ncbi:hypothetical protein BD31_I1305 [Candidatus Nitrosopumilus salaria BD31]|uniref:Uncharacterized protein n=1 Tax=Candidatus Nitrosopumilus salarius BD31 TaxID=859350 RepID=I3D2V2_9ARCH|nr:hypothetical protein [Candidatus Nitrosopumilus salaria]EIJ66045.1 hypothetical protein BD31_I1305 [Candidatus Nitrosopumilus salaria BD31]
MGKKKKPTFKKTNLPPYKKIPIKKRYWFFLGLCIIVIFAGIIQLTYAFTGGYVEEISKPLPLWKQYQVGFTTVDLPGKYVTHYEYLHGLANVRGDLNLSSTSFSVKNKIHVDIILRPELKEVGYETAKFTVENPPFENSTIVVYDGHKFQKLMDTFPQPFFIVFVGAENIENIEKNNDRFAIINVTRNYDKVYFEGSGDIEFELDGERTILFLDPTQLKEYMALRKEFTSNIISFDILSTPKQPDFPDISSNSTIYAFKHRESYANLLDGKTVLPIDIESEDALDEIILKNIAYATPGFFIIPIGLTFFVMSFNKINKIKNQNTL